MDSPEFSFEIMRSNLLIEVLNKYYRNNYELSSVSQENDIGETYYVIHPLLKHLTLIPLNIMQ